MLFKEKTVPKTALKNCLEAGRWAPSCYNNQPWKFVLIEGSRRINGFAGAFSRGNHWCLKAPMIGFLVSSPKLDCVSENNGNLEYYQFDCGMAMMSFTIQAEAESLSVHQMAGYFEKEVKKLLKIPKNDRIITAFALGYEEKLKNYKDEIHPKLLERIKKTKRTRKPLKEIYSINGS